MADIASDHRLIARAPLADIAKPGRFGKPTTEPGVILRERTGLATACVIARRGRGAEVTALLSTLTGGLPVASTCRRWSTNGISVTGLAPNQWLATAGPLHAAGFVAGLAHRLAGLAQVTDQSDARVVLNISGPQARAMLAKGIQIDLDPGVFPLGSAAQTLATHLTVQIVVLDLSPVFELSTMATFAGSLWSWLAASSAEFGGEFRQD